MVNKEVNIYSANPIYCDIRFENSDSTMPGTGNINIVLFQ